MYECNVSPDDGSTYITSRLNNPTKTWCCVVSLTSSPICECEMYKSALIPCPCICLAYGKWQQMLPRHSQKSLRVDSNVHNCWNPKMHPLYKLAGVGATTITSLQSMSALRTKDSVSLPTPMFDTEAEVQAMQQFKYQGVTETMRYTTAKNLFDDGIATAMKTELQYRHFMLCMKVGGNCVPGHQTLQGLSSFILAAA